MRSSRTALGAAVTAVLLAVYELLAIATNSTPTITEFIEARPAWFELVSVGGLMAWLAYHFGWFARLLKLLGR